MYDHGAPNPGDLGRRVVARRRELELSREQLAAEAGMSLPYLGYLETRPANPTMSCLIRLADALHTSTDELLGAARAAASPESAGAPSRRPRLRSRHLGPVFPAMSGRATGTVRRHGRQA
jgi:transcriptional regulator with XRE-family HTH domain